MIFWLGVAALVVTVISLFIDNLIIQTLIFVILSGLLLFFTRPFIEKFVTKNDKTVVTNAYSIIGKEAKVIKDTDPVTKLLQIKIGTETWTAISAENVDLKAGEIVLVDKIDGVKAIVSRI